MDAYLDDLIIYSNTLEEQVEHIKFVLDRLREQKFWLSEKKLYFLVKELKVLGRVIDSQGIRMDQTKLTRWPSGRRR